MISNCQLPIANGVRVDGKNGLKHVINNLLPPAHEKTVRLNDCDRTWVVMSEKQPWVRVFKKWNNEKLQCLVRIAIDVSQVETVSAQSWPSGSLAVKHSNHVLCDSESQGQDADFVLLIHQHPVITIISRLEMNTVAQLLKECFCYSAQTDGSADKQQVDFKL